MPARIPYRAVALVVSFGAFLAAAEDAVQPARPALPEILNLQSIQEKRPDIDSPELSEICQLQRARYNVALKEFQRKFQLFRMQKLATIDMLDCFKRLRMAEHGLPGRPKVGQAGEAADHAWALKEAELFKWLEEFTQAKFDENSADSHELLEFQFYHLDVKERLASFAKRNKGSIER